MEGCQCIHVYGGRSEEGGGNGEVYLLFQILQDKMNRNTLTRTTKICTHAYVLCCYVDLLSTWSKYLHHTNSSLVWYPRNNSPLVLSEQSTPVKEYFFCSLTKNISYKKTVNWNFVSLCSSNKEHVFRLKKKLDSHELLFSSFINRIV